MAGTMASARSELNRTVLNTLLTELEDAPEIAAHRFDLDAVLCDDSSRLLSATPDGELVRFDGLHFSVEGSLRFAELYGPELLGLARQR